MRNALLSLVVLAMAVPALADRTETILQQSDDSRENLWDGNFGTAQWFEAPADSHILSASLYCWTLVDFTKNVCVWDNDDSGDYDKPGTVLGSVSHNFDYGPSWTWSDYVDLTGEGITMVNGEKFWVGIDISEGSYPRIGLDDDAPHNGQVVTTNSIYWHWYPLYDLMVRVKIDDDFDPPYVDGQNPAPSRTGGADPGTDVVFHCKDDDKGVDSDTIDFSADDGTRADVSGSLDIDDSDPNDVVCTFTPDSDLPEGETITCTVDGLLADGLGNELDDDEVWSFTVGYTTVDDASLGEIKAGYH